MKIHLIACGGAVMHNMTIALHKKGYEVTGSDDEIFDPAKSRLASHGLLPEKWGWFPEKITKDIDVIILGMHARIDNPELQKAKELGLQIFSFPEYLYEQSKDKTRVVIGGSHGKTTITSMIMHVLNDLNIDFDYMVGAQIEGFDTMVKITEQAKITILEGDEYLSSPIDLRPKFHLYKAHIGVISGIAWDHMNVFPTFDIYKDQFSIFIDSMIEKGSLIYCNEDAEVKAVVEKSKKLVDKMPYSGLKYEVVNEETIVNIGGRKTPVKVFGQHNMQNMNAAYLVCKQLGVGDEQFAESISKFKGAARRLELIARQNGFVMYKDFAHSPSKLNATVKAVKEQFPNKHIIACMELHTFSSLNAAFLSNYANTMDNADEAIVYFNPHTIAHKKLEFISANQVKEAFANDDLKIFESSSVLLEELMAKDYSNTVLLMMSSGNFDGFDLKKISENIILKKCCPK
ncbi:MAG: Mur ligase family protein [Bacteroidota bacterium]